MLVCLKEAKEEVLMSFEELTAKIINVAPLKADKEAPVCLKLEPIQVSNQTNVAKVVKRTVVEVAETMPTEEVLEEVVEPIELPEDEIVEPEMVQEEEGEEPEFVWDGPVLNAYIGTVEGPSGKETYYNLSMSYVVELMHNAGFEGEYWVREDGVKMFGEYIMCAASLDIRPKGTILETSLGTAMVCDTGGFAKYNKYQLDIAVAW